ncbi:nucleoporin Nup120/160 family protein [Mycobacterium kansasii]|uniref:Nucleoporin Nup120/160 family protein n=1 Tax=Mycobacterium kansasii TaxID=1768 RepID=A0A1V3XEW8_MYCKA|nr:nucleoporin Nup120/160 family protein [Mycobacterium kansasii]
MRLWDAGTGQPIGAPLTGHTLWVTSVAFSPDGRRIVSGSADDTLRLWDAGTGQPIGAPLTGHTASVSSVAFSPDGHRIVSGSYDKTLRLWDAATGQPIGAPLTGHTESVTSVAFSPDGHRIVSGSTDTTLRLWDAATGAPIGAPLTGHTDSVDSVAFSSDGRRIVSGGSIADGTVRLWDVSTGQQIGPPLSGHTGTVFSVAFSPDGRRIVSGGLDMTLRLWPGPAAWPDLLCDKLVANMSHKQWHDWVFPDIDYIRLCPNLPVPNTHPTRFTTRPTAIHGADRPQHLWQKTVRDFPREVVIRSGAPNSERSGQLTHRCSGSEPPLRLLPTGVEFRRLGGRRPRTRRDSGETARRSRSGFRFAAGVEPNYHEASG